MNCSCTLIYSLHTVGICKTIFHPWWLYCTAKGNMLIFLTYVMYCLAKFCQASIVFFLFNVFLSSFSCYFGMVSVASLLKIVKWVSYHYKHFVTVFSDKLFLNNIDIREIFFLEIWEMSYSYWDWNWEATLGLYNGILKQSCDWWLLRKFLLSA